MKIINSYIIRGRRKNDRLYGKPRYRWRIMLVAVRKLCGKFYILLTVRPVMIHGKWPNWSTILFYVFISVLYMFRANSWSSSRESIVSIQHLVYVTLCRWPFRLQIGNEFPLLPAHEKITDTKWHIKVKVKAVCGSYSTAALRHIVLLPEWVPSFIRRGAAHTKRRERPLLAKEGTTPGI